MNKLYFLVVFLFSVYTNSNAQIISKPLAQKQVQGRFGITQTQQSMIQKLMQDNPSSDIRVVLNDENGTPAFLSRILTSSGYSNGFSSKQEAALNFIERYRSLLKIETPTGELQLVDENNDPIGFTHLKFNQYYKGLRISTSQLIVHFASDGAITAINGRYVPTPSISVVPTISEDGARTIASQHSGNIPATQTELMLYIQNGTPVLAYEVAVPTEMTPERKVTVQATTGAILDDDDGLRYDEPTTGTGIGNFNISRPLNIYQATNKFGVSGTQYFLIDASKPMYISPVDSFKGIIATYDAHNDISVNPYANAGLVYNPNGNNNFQGDTSLKASVDAHYFTGIVYDYYKQRFNRNSYDNNGGSLINVVHYQQNYNNAFWNSSFMTYGDGDGVEFSNLTGALDVIAHELTHAVIDKSADLTYRGQSGALNESYADVFGAMLDSSNWQIGENVYTPGTLGDALRDLSNPNQGGSSLSDNGWQPKNMAEYQYLPYTNDNDHGGVHTNSGIPNRAAYLVASAIGRGKTEQIYYRALTFYLTNGSLFVDARFASLQAAIDLFGLNSTEYNAVAIAFDAVGITYDFPHYDAIFYDDGSPAKSIYVNVNGGGLVQQFTALDSGSLQYVLFYYVGDGGSGGDGSFYLKVFNDNNGTPGTEIYTSVALTPSNVGTPHWVTVSHIGDDIKVGRDFYVGIFNVNTNRPAIGVDTIANERAWYYNGSTWISLGFASASPYTIFIQAVVKTVTDLPLTTVTAQYNKDWNLLSLPVVVRDPKKTSLFPSALSNLFGYNRAHGYVAKDSAVHGNGYWLRLPSAETRYISGKARLTDTVNVSFGWNMIGSISDTISTSCIVPVGTSIQSSYFGYMNGYVASDMIIPGKAYWVKVSTDGVLILKGCSVKRYGVVKQVRYVMCEF